MEWLNLSNGGNFINEKFNNDFFLVDSWSCLSFVVGRIEKNRFWGEEGDIGLMVFFFVYLRRFLVKFDECRVFVEERGRGWRWRGGRFYD